jgi:hypothetical protein
MFETIPILNVQYLVGSYSEFFFMPQHVKGSTLFEPTILIDYDLDGLVQASMKMEQLLVLCQE